MSNIVPLKQKLRELQIAILKKVQLKVSLILKEKCLVFAFNYNHEQFSKWATSIYFFFLVRTGLIGYRYSEFHAIRIYNLLPNFMQCSRVESYGVKVSLFLCDVRVLDLRRKS